MLINPTKMGPNGYRTIYKRRGPNLSIRPPRSIGIAFLVIGLLTSAAVWQGQAIDGGWAIFVYVISGAIGMWGLFHILNLRVLKLDFATQQYSHKSGIPGFYHKCQGDFSELGPITLSEIRYARTSDQSRTNASRAYQAWDISLQIRCLNGDGFPLWEAHSTKQAENIAQIFAQDLGQTVQKE